MLTTVKGGEKVQKNIQKKLTFLSITLVLALAAMGAVSAADNVSENMSVTSVERADVSIVTNTTNSSPTTADPQIWNGGVPVSRGGQPAGYNWGTIQNAINAALPGDTIMLENGVTLSGVGNTQISISKNLIFDVLGGGTATLDGGGTRYAFDILSGTTVTFNDIIFQNFYYPGEGAISVIGTLNLNNCIFWNNIANDGAAIYNSGNLNINNCQFYSNRATNRGSGIFTTGTGTVTIANSIIRDHVNGDGIGIYVNSGNPTITGNDIYGNYWRGIYINGGNALITNNNIHNNGHATRQGDGIWVNNGNPVITGNNIRNNAEDGIHVSGCSGGSSNPLQIHYNSIVDNGEWGLHVMNDVYVSATYNWWGTNNPVYTRQSSDPSYPRDIFEQRNGGQRVTWNPYLYLRISPSPATIYNGDTSTVTADLTRDNNNNLAPGTVPNGTPVTFALTNGPYGSLTAPLTRTTTNGVATIVFTANDPTAPHTQTVRGTVDHQQVTCNINVQARSADLGIIKTDNPDPVVAGNQLTYTITVRNNGPAAIPPTSTFTVIDTLPAGFTATSYTASAGSYTSATGAWTGVTLASGQSITLTIVGTVSPSATGTLTNTVTVTVPAGFTDPYLANNTASSTTTVNRVADLGVTKSDNPDPVVAGNQLTYVITVTNGGPSTILSSDTFTVSDTLPAGFTATSYTASAGSYTSATGAWTGVTLASGQSVTLTIVGTVNPSATGSLTNTATVTPPAGVTDPNPNNNQATATTTVNRVADLAISKSDNPDPVVAGNQLTYTVTVTNNGPSTILSSDTFTVTDLLPVNFVAMSWSYPGNYVPGIGTWNGVTLASGQSVTLTIVGTIIPDATGTLSNTATVTPPAGVTDPNPNNNVATSTTTVNRVAAMTVTKTADQANYNVGDTVTYNLVVTNTGPSSANNVVVTDTVPAGLTFVSATNGGTESGGVVTWTVPYLAVNGQFTPSFTATVNQGTQGQNIPNTASAYNTENPTPVTSQPVTIHVNNAVLTVDKNPDRNPANYNVGEEVVYTITVRNTGPDAATGVVLTDTIPAGLTFVSATNGGTESGGIVTWNIGNLGLNEVFTALVTARVNAGTQGQTLTNTLSGVNTQNPTAITDTSDIYVNNAPLSITKTTDKTRPNVGETVTYTINVLTGVETDPATGVVVTDTLPAGLTFVSATGGGVWDANTRTVTWNVGNLASGDQFTATVTATVTGEAAAKTLVNTATVDSAQLDDQVSAQASIYVPSADLVLTKTVDKTQPTVKDTVIFTLIVNNNGPDTAVDVTVNDKLPAGLSYVSHVANYGTYDPATGLWTISSLPNGASGILAITAVVEESGRIVNQANVTALTWDPNLEGNAASAALDVQAKPVPVNGKTVAMQKTGAPFVGLLLAFFMLLVGMVLPKRK